MNHALAASSVWTNSIMIAWLAVALVLVIRVKVLKPSTAVGPVRCIDPRAAAHLVLMAGFLLATLFVVPVAFVQTVGPDPENPDQAPSWVRVIAPLATYVVGSIVGLAMLSRLDRHQADVGLALRKFGRAIAPAVVGLVIAVPITLLTAALSSWVMKSMGKAPPEGHSMLLFMRSEVAVWMAGLAILNAVIFAPLFEELLFRVGLQTGLGSVFPSRWPAIVVCSVLFAVTHEAWTIAPIFVLSLAIGYAYERTGNAWVPILMHVGFNLMNVIGFLT
jgi:uncharacterized protein